MRSLSMIVLGLGVLAGSIAHAAEPPMLSGTWTGAGPSVGADDGWETARSASLIVTEQRGQVFRGHVKYEGGEEDFLGVVQADGKTIRLTNDDGQTTATLLAPDEMEVCYVEGGDDAMANCSILKRSE